MATTAIITVTEFLHVRQAVRDRSDLRTDLIVRPAALSLRMEEVTEVQEEEAMQVQVQRVRLLSHQQVTTQTVRLRSHQPVMQIVRLRNRRPATMHPVLQ